jgi:hypothetical protein
MDDYIRRLDFYEDCRYHPMLCTKSDGDDLEGISLLNRTIGRCSRELCGAYKLTAPQAYRAVFFWTWENFRRFFDGCETDWQSEKYEEEGQRFTLLYDLFVFGYARPEHMTDE